MGVTNKFIFMNKLNFKLLLVGLGMMCILCVFAAATYDKNGNKEIFPKEITTFVKDNLPNEKIVKYEYDDGKIKVKCSDWTKLTFNRNLECIKMENDKQGLTQTLVSHLPNPAVLYLKTNYNGITITEIEHKSYGYKVELRTSPNDCEILFNKDGSVKKECNY